MWYELNITHDLTFPKTPSLFHLNEKIPDGTVINCVAFILKVFVAIDV